MVRTEFWEWIATLPVNRVTQCEECQPAFCRVIGGKEDEALQKLTALIRDLERMLELTSLGSLSKCQREAMAKLNKTTNIVT